MTDPLDQRLRRHGAAVRSGYRPPVPAALPDPARARPAGPRWVVPAVAATVIVALVAVGLVVQRVRSDDGRPTAARPARDITFYAGLPHDAGPLVGSNGQPALGSNGMAAFPGGAVGWIDDDTLAVVTWGSGNCPNPVATVTGDGAHRVVLTLRRYSDDTVCFTNAVMYTSVVPLPEQIDPRAELTVVIPEQDLTYTLPAR